MFKKIKFYLISGIVLLAGLVLLFNRIFAVGLVIIGIAIFIFILWEFLLKENKRQIDSLNQKLLEMNSDKKIMEQELEDYSKRKLNISEVNTIFELGLFEVDTNFKRALNKQFKIKDKTVQFIGVINVDFIAKYGVDFKKLMVKINEETKELSISNAKPEFLSFIKRTCKWEIAEILEFNIPFFGTEHWKTNPKLDKIANEIKEETRIKVEQETENGPSELNWITESLRKHVERTLELFLGTQGYKIRFTEIDEDGYKSLYEISKDNELGQIGADTKNSNNKLPGL